MNSYLLLNSTENESGGSDGGYGQSGYSSGRNSLGSHSPSENSLIENLNYIDENQNSDNEQQENLCPQTPYDEAESDIDSGNNVLNLNESLKASAARRTRRKSTTDVKVCLVCGDKATGYHFNAMTCEGCKGFFRRSVKNSKPFACAYHNQCEITPHNRRKCQSCRYSKCLKIGMKSDCVLNDDELEEKRQVILRNRIKRSQRPPATLPEKDARDLSELLKIFHSSMAKQFSPKHFRGYHNIKTVKKKLKDCFAIQLEMQKDGVTLYLEEPKSNHKVPVNINMQYVQHISDIVTTLFYETINFCKQLYDFKRLSHADQICLLRCASWEMLILQCCQYVKNNEFTLDDMSYGEADLNLCGLDNQIIERMLSFGRTILAHNLSREELVLTYTLIIFCEDRCGLDEVLLVSQIQERYALMLQQLMNLSKNTQKRNGKNRFPEIILLLPELRSITFMLRPLLQSMNNQFGEDLPALLNEMIF